MIESDGESATEYTKLMTSFVNSQYSKTDSSLQSILTGANRDRMPQSVSDPSVGGRSEMYSPVRNVCSVSFLISFYSISPFFLSLSLCVIVLFVQF